MFHPLCVKKAFFSESLKRYIWCIYMANESFSALCICIISLENFRFKRRYIRFLFRPWHLTHAVSASRLAVKQRIKKIQIKPKYFNQRDGMNVDFNLLPSMQSLECNLIRIGAARALYRHLLVDDGEPIPNFRPHYEKFSGGGLWLYQQFNSEFVSKNGLVNSCDNVHYPT